MAKGSDVNRRGFLTGAFRGRDLAPVASEGLVAPQTAPVIPEWDDNLQSVLEQMDDLSGIEEQ